MWQWLETLWYEDSVTWKGFVMQMSENLNHDSVRYIRNASSWIRLVYQEQTRGQVPTHWCILTSPLMCACIEINRWVSVGDSGGSFLSTFAKLLSVWVAYLTQCFLKHYGNFLGVSLCCSSLPFTLLLVGLLHRQTQRPQPDSSDVIVCCPSSSHPRHTLIITAIAATAPSSEQRKCFDIL